MLFHYVLLTYLCCFTIVRWYKLISKSNSLCPNKSKKLKYTPIQACKIYNCAQYMRKLLEFDVLGNKSQASRVQVNAWINSFVRMQTWAGTVVLKQSQPRTTVIRHFSNCGSGNEHNNLKGSENLWHQNSCVTTKKKKKTIIRSLFVFASP